MDPVLRSRWWQCASHPFVFLDVTAEYDPKSVCLNIFLISLLQHRVILWETVTVFSSTFMWPQKMTKIQCETANLSGDTEPRRRISGNVFPPGIVVRELGAWVRSSLLLMWKIPSTFFSMWSFFAIVTQIFLFFADFYKHTCHISGFSKSPQCYWSLCFPSADLTTCILLLYFPSARENGEKRREWRSTQRCEFLGCSTDLYLMFL